MSKKISVALMIAALVALTSVATVGAAGTPPPAISSGFQLQNRSETSEATVSIDYYDADGNLVETNPDTLAANASKSFYVPNVLSQPDGRYSVVVSSSEELFSLVNEVTAAGDRNVEATHSGLTSEETGSPLYLPWVVCEYYDYNSMFAIQNAGGSAANITVEFYQSGESTATQDYVFPNVKAGGAVFLDMTADPYNADLNGFFGSVVIRSAGDATPLAAVLNDTNPSGSFLRSYNAVLDDASSTKLYAPQVTAGYYGFSSGITLQNPNGVEVTGSIKYYQSGATTPVKVQSFSVAANSAKPIYLPNVAGIPTNFNGTAVIETTGGNKIMGIANHDHVPAGPAASYNLIPVEDAATTLSMPQTVRHYYGFEAGWQVYNIGPEDVTVRVTYFDKNGSRVTQDTHNISANAGFTQYLGDSRGDGLGSDFNGGGVIEVTSGNGSLVGIANFVSPNGGDYQRVYNMFTP
ncbi:MAG: hypothetical protein U9R72_06550 [Chloroflexota bacterium]|nr:hypothetical protein [Chloroflexota bacterium]